MTTAGPHELRTLGVAGYRPNEELYPDIRYIIGNIQAQITSRGQFKVTYYSRE